MKKQSTLKAKKIHNHAPNAAKAYSCMKYDRNFVRDLLVVNQHTRCNTCV